MLASAVAGFAVAAATVGIASSAHAEQDPAPANSSVASYESAPPEGVTAGPSSLPLPKSTATTTPGAADAPGPLSPADIARLRKSPSTGPAKATAGARAGGAKAAAAAYYLPDYYLYGPTPTAATYLGVDNWRLAGGTFLLPGTSAEPDSYVQWGKAALIMQNDGNLVLYDERGVYDSRYARWSSGTSGNPGAYAYFQPDGNFVIYSASGAVIRKRLPSNTCCHSGWNLHVQEDGNLVIYAPVWDDRWATNTAH